MKLEKVCQHCGIVYKVNKSQYERSKFCSDKCFRRSKNTQLLYTCDNCGKEFLIRKARIIDKEYGITKYLFCSKECAKNAQKPRWDDILALFEKYGYILVSTEYINAKTKLEYICKNHKEKGVQSVLYSNLKNGFGCRYCGFERTAGTKRLTIDQVNEIFKNHDMELVEGQVYHNTSQKLDYICIHHRDKGVQQMTTSNAYKNRCPYCNASKGELKIAEYLKANKIEYTIQKTYDNLLGLGGGKLSYDFFLPKFNMLIEYQGEFHDGKVSYQTEGAYKKQVEHDNRKRKFANDNKIRLLEIWYNDFKNIESILSTELSKCA